MDAERFNPADCADKGNELQGVDGVKPIKLKCQRCGNKPLGYWLYKGKKKHKANCPNCGTTVYFGGGKNIVGAKG